MIKKILLYCILLGLSVNIWGQNRQLGTSTGLWTNPSVADLTDARQNGIDYIEVALNQCYRGISEDEIIPCIYALKEKIDSAGVQVWSIHLPFSRTLDISVVDDSAREKNVHFIAQMIQLSAIFKPSRLVLHPSSEPIADSIREQRIANSIQSIGILRKYAEKTGAQLCMENLPRTCLGNTPEELLRIIESYPDVGICFDTNHYLQGDPIDFVRKAGHRIGTIHVSDYDGIDERHWIPGDGNIRWGELVHHIRKAGYSGVFMFETTKDRDNKSVSPTQLADSFKMIEKESNAYGKLNN
ncbi:MAG: sugar phosphate isomerase/epimerase [Dysgonamonadaceae bacterium]|jgi:sugar phosphate isomerase/epimerase|nr:sugar phosphate isomerase/epimerase [Dysgonamonadaceae bacterium]